MNTYQGLLLNKHGKLRTEMSGATVEATVLTSELQRCFIGWYCWPFLMSQMSTGRWSIEGKM